MSWVRCNMPRARIHPSIPTKPVGLDMGYTSCLQYIDAILYINLEHRTDRKQHILNEIKKIDPKLSKTHRIDAIKNTNGALGCSLSHIKALELILENKWENVLILEDDFTFTSNPINSIVYAFQNIPQFDMILLGTGTIDLNVSPVDNVIVKVHSSQTTSGYILNRNYIDVLLANYTESSNKMKDEYKSEWCLDQYWKRLMHGNWYSFKNKIGYQYDNYSDIEKKHVMYKT